MNSLMEQINDSNYGGISVAREMCWALSNITAGNQQQVAKVIDSEIFKKIIDIALNTKQPDVKREALWVICNAATETDAEGRLKLLQISNGQILSSLINSCSPLQDLRLLKNILESMAEFLALDVLMGWSKTENSVAYHFEKAGGIDALEETQKCSN